MGGGLYEIKCVNYLYILYSFFFFFLVPVVFSIFATNLRFFVFCFQSYTTARRQLDARCSIVCQIS